MLLFLIIGVLKSSFLEFATSFSATGENYLQHQNSRKHGGYALGETMKAMTEISWLYSHRSTPQCSARSIMKRLFSKWILFNLVGLTVQNIAQERASCNWNKAKDQNYHN